MRYTVRLEWTQDDGGEANVELAVINVVACRAADDIGLKLDTVKPLLAKLQDVVVAEQIHRYCDDARRCSSCGHRRSVKDSRSRRLDTSLGTVLFPAPRFKPCGCSGNTRVASPVTRLVPQRVTPELLDIQARLATDLSYSKAAALLRMLLPVRAQCGCPRPGYGDES